MDILPVEILTHIFQYLHHDDLFSCSLVSKKFYSAFLDPKITKNYLISVDFIDLDKFLSFLTTSSRVYSLKLGSHVTIGKNFNDLSLFENVKELTIETPDGFQLLKFMPNLVSLEVNNRDTKAIILNVNDAEAKKVLRGVKQLKISRNFDLFENILVLTPKLEFLHLEGFTCKSQKSFNRNSLLSLKTLQNTIKSHEFIKGLCLHSYSTEPASNEEFIQKLYANKLLEKISLTIDGVDSNFVIMLLIVQESLQHLDLTCWNGFDRSIFEVISNIDSLKSIVFRGKMSTAGLSFKRLTKLKSLQFKDTFDSEEDHGHILSEINNLQDLEIDTKCLNACSNCVEKLVGNNSKLRNLNLSKSNVDDYNLEKLLNELKYLKKLQLNDCKNLKRFNLVHSGLEELQMNHCLKVDFGKEIKLENLVYGSFNHLDGVNFEFIKQLTENCPLIEKLFLSNCQNLDDASVELITTQLSRLQTLDLSWCKSLTKLTEYSLWKTIRLRYLTAHGQERLEMSVILMFSHIKTLHVYQLDEVYTRHEFENQKYSTTMNQKKLQTMTRCLLFLNRKK